VKNETELKLQKQLTGLLIFPIVAFSIIGFHFSMFESLIEDIENDLPL